MESLPDLATLSDDDLKTLIDELTEEENEVSFRRRLLQGRIDILRAERTARLKGKESPTSTSRSSTTPLLRSAPRTMRRVAMSHVYCGECGFRTGGLELLLARGARLEKASPVSRR